MKYIMLKGHIPIGTVDTFEQGMKAITEEISKTGETYRCIGKEMAFGVTVPSERLLPEHKQGIA